LQEYTDFDTLCIEKAPVVAYYVQLFVAVNGGIIIALLVLLATWTLRRFTQAVTSNKFELQLTDLSFS
jgi:hypothetical protein